MKLPPATSKTKFNSKTPYKGQVHTPASSKGLGDYYGSGIVAKFGKVRDDTVGFVPMSQTQMKTPPKALA